MTTLYRSPTLIVDEHEWHLAVTIAPPRGRPIKQYFWRPLSLKRYMWLPLTSWQGPTPKRMWKLFQVHHTHANRAMGSELARRDAIAALATRRPNGASLRNPGAEIAA